MNLQEATEDSFKSLAAPAIEFKEPWSSGGLVFSNNVKKDSRARVLAYMKTKSTSSMVIEAVGAIEKGGEKGASLPAITKWIIANYAVFDIDKVKLMVKKSIMKLLKEGTIERSETAKKSLGPSGSFVLGNKKRKVTKAKKSKVQEKSFSDAE